MVTIFGTTYYTIGTGLVVLALLAPLLFLLARWMLRPNVEDAPRRVRLLAEGGLTLGLLLLAAVGLYWDVYLIGQRAKELCEETGLVVFERVQSPGFVGDTSVGFWATHGFRFVEKEIDAKKYRFEVVDGVAARTIINEFSVPFEVITTSSPAVDSSRYPDSVFTRSTTQVKDRTSSRVLGQVMSISIDHPWTDRVFYIASGLTSRPWVCGRTKLGKLEIGRERATTVELVLAVIAP